MILHEVDASDLIKVRPTWDRVLRELRRRKNGATVAHFRIGFRLTSRIHDLREAGHDIETVSDLTESGYIVRYVLMNEKV